eukprot:GHVN01062243.1.p1 GENE.GHVN01062243.1~~GHVN01062243.1.p1  ORF type:complete len:415 (-),score=125.39 GHVN01062243.1:214-1458(-)
MTHTFTSMPLFDAHSHLQLQKLTYLLTSSLTTSYARGVTHHAVNATCESDWSQVDNLAKWVNRRCDVSEVMEAGVVREVSAVREVKEVSEMRDVGEVREVYPAEGWSSETRPLVLPQFGIHPWHSCDPRSQNWEQKLRDFLIRWPLAGIGEAGLDKCQKKRCPMAEQIAVLTAQLDIAHSLNRTASLHCVHAHNHLTRLLTERHSQDSPPIVLHSYAGGTDRVPVYTSLNCYFSMSGCVVAAAEVIEAHKRDLLVDGKVLKAALQTQETLYAIPSHRLLIETDSPDQLPRSLKSSHRTSPTSITSSTSLTSPFSLTSSTLPPLVDSPFVSGRLRQHVGLTPVRKARMSEVSTSAHMSRVGEVQVNESHKVSEVEVNEPAHLSLSCASVAYLLGESVDEVSKRTFENAAAVFMRK